MGQVLHGSATTTEAIRRVIQHSQEGVRMLARRYSINPKTVAKWKMRTQSPIGRPDRSGQGRRCYHRGRGGRRRLPSLHDWSWSGFSKVQIRHLHFRDLRPGRQLLMCYGIQFTTPGARGSAVPLIKEAIANGERFRAHVFEYACAHNDVEHRTTKAKHPWTNGQVERMSRTVKDATVERFYYQSHDQLRQHLADFVATYNFGRRLKTLKDLTPYEGICKAWASQPNRFARQPP